MEFAHSLADGCVLWRPVSVEEEETAAGAAAGGDGGGGERRVKRSGHAVYADEEGNVTIVGGKMRYGA